MDIIQLVRKDVRGKRGRLQEVSKQTGVARGTLKHIVYDDPPPSPSYRTIDKLREFYATR